LKFDSRGGHEYVFRSVDKDPAGNFDYRLRNSLIVTVTRDQTSSQHPYGALVTDTLMKELDILHPSPHLYIMPDDPRLGRFREDYAGMLGMLEDRPDDVDEGELPFAGADRIMQSADLFRNLYDGYSMRIEDRAYARARLFDIWVGDWSRHEDNWKWAGYRRGNILHVKPIARDRDQVFSKLDGFFPWLASREWAVPNLENFGYDPPNIRSITYQARHMDRLLASELTLQDWLEEAQTIRNRIDADLVSDAVARMPGAAYKKSGPEIADKLKTRLDDLEAYAEKFYYQLADQPDVVGTNQSEKFDITRRPDGTTKVEVYAQEDRKMHYQRIFDPEETREIRIYGLGGRDSFEVRGEAMKAIYLRLIGGPGKDVIRDRSSILQGGIRTSIYEIDPGAEVFTGTEGRRIYSWNDRLYYYDRTRFAYNNYRPLLYLTFNNFNGLAVRGGITFTRQSYDNEDFSSRHRLESGVSTLGNFSFAYRGRWHQLMYKWDWLLEASVSRSFDFNFFFGLGNDTVFDQELFDQDFYLVLINSIALRTGLQRDFLTRSYVSLLLSYERNKALGKDNTILDRPEPLFGTDTHDLLHLRAKLEFDFRDHEVFPSRGLRVFAQQEIGLADGEEYGVTDTYAEYFATWRAYYITLGLRAGYSNSFEQVPFYRLPQLGEESGLRGY
ncbi:MAG: BamA/TamA family outer membrane protein, partial [Saprospiraceae bacterium]|nr:BamA/TamA family outer membrane protein [Saprospiraceae bacterium]